MSKVDLNALLNGFSGKLGNAVFRRVGDKTIVAHRPKKSDVAPKESVLLQRERFKRAAAYARIKMEDPEAKAEYQLLAAGKPNMTAFIMAVTDYLRPPKITRVLTSKYTGNPGDVIVIQPQDDFKIKSIQVIITGANGTVIENGDASVMPGELDWQYLVTQPNAVVAGTKIKVIALDRPGNEVSFEALV